MKNFLRVALAAALLAAGAASAQDVQERTIKFGHLNNTDHPVSMGVKKFAEILAAKSGGKLKVQEFPSNQLGNELQQQAQRQLELQNALAQAGARGELRLVYQPICQLDGNQPRLIGVEALLRWQHE